MSLISSTNKTKYIIYIFVNFPDIRFERRGGARTFIRFNFIVTEMKCNLAFNQKCRVVKCKSMYI